MGEAQGTLFQPEFNRSIKVQTFDQKITSHAGALLLRETDHPLGLVESLAEQIIDPRDPNKVRYTANELIRERIDAMALGDEDQDDLDRLAHDPAMRMATWNRPGQEVLEQRLASQPPTNAARRCLIAADRLVGEPSRQSRSVASPPLRLDAPSSA